MPVDSIPTLLNTPQRTRIPALYVKDYSPVETYLSAQPQSVTIVEISLRQSETYLFSDADSCEFEQVHPL